MPIDDKGELTNGNLIRWRLDQVEKRLDGECARSLDLATRVVELEERVNAHDGSRRSIEEKLDAANSWLRGVMGSLVLALLLLIANLVAQRQTAPNASVAAPKAGH